MIIIRSAEEIEAIKAPCRIVASVLEDLRGFIVPGVRTIDIDARAMKLIKDRKAESAFKGYRGFPGNICCSVNEEVVHGIPGKRVIKEGDLVSIDVGVKLGGYYGDAAVSLAIGKVMPQVQKLIDVTRRSLEMGIEKARAGNRLSDISHSVQQIVEANGFSVVTDFVGHGIGAKMHEDPPIPNYGRPNEGPRLKEGMVLCIEPMINMGAHEVEVLDDGWTAVAKDGKPSCHFEHTIVIREFGPEILTKL